MKLNQIWNKAIEMKIAKLVLISLFPFSLLLNSCNKNSFNESDKVIIAGHILNSEEYPDFSAISIIINDFAQPGQKIYVSKIDLNGNFSFGFEKFFPQDIYFRYGNKLHIIFIHPGDSIYIQFDATEFINYNPDSSGIIRSLKFSGDAVQINQELNSFLPLLHETYQVFMEMEEKYKTFTPSDFKSFLLTRRDDKLSILKDFINKNNPSKTFIAWANYYLIYGCKRELFRYSWYNPFLNKRKGEQLVLSDNYLDFIDKTQKRHSPAIMCSSYKFYLDEYLNYIIRKKAMVEKHPDFSNDKLLEYQTVLKYLKKNVSGYPLEFMISHELYSILENQKLPEVYEELYPVYGKYITNEYFKNALNEKYTEVKLQERNPEGSYFFQKQSQALISGMDILPEILEKNKGKVIYIDFWATWCGPCLSEMPFSLKIQNEFRGQQIAFVYLCIKSKKDQWESLITEYKLKGDNYLLSDSQFDAFSELFQITSIPHYVIINNNGEIIDKDAMRPSSENSLNSELIYRLKTLIED